MAIQGGDASPGDYVFAPKCRARCAPATATLRERLRGLCAAAGVPAAHPHTFRAYVATKLRERGMSEAGACRFLGHRSLGTHRRHYWREDADAIAVGVLAETDDGTLRGLQRRIREEREALAALRVRTERLELLSTAPSLDAVPASSTKAATECDAFFRTLVH